MSHHLRTPIVLSFALSICALVLFGACSGTPPPPRTEEQLPMIEASYTPDFFGTPWTIQIWEDGRVEKKKTTKSGRKRLRRVMLSDSEARELASFLSTTEFFELPESIYYPEEDRRMFAIRAVTSNNSHRVQIWAPEEIGCNPDVREFLKLWNQILDLVEPPGACGSAPCKIEVRCP